MSPSADPARDAVVRTVLTLERLCLEADGALVERRWSDLATLFERQEHLTAELRETFAEQPRLAPKPDDRLTRRLRGILAYRDDQLRRLCAVRDETASRLDTISKVNALSRSIGKHPEPSHLLNAQY